MLAEMLIAVAIIAPLAVAACLPRRHQQAPVSPAQREAMARLEPFEDTRSSMEKMADALGINPYPAYIVDTSHVPWMSLFVCPCDMCRAFSLRWDDPSCDRGALQGEIDAWREWAAKEKGGEE